MGLFDGLGGNTDPATRGAAVYSLSELGKEALSREEGSPETIMVMQTLDNLNQATAVAISKESHMNLERAKTILNQLVYGRYVRKIN